MIVLDEQLLGRGLERDIHRGEEICAKIASSE
jgi:hypothetical protein